MNLCNCSNWKKKKWQYHVTTAYYIIFIVAINKNNINTQQRIDLFTRSLECQYHFHPLVKPEPNTKLNLTRRNFPFHEKQWKSPGVVSSLARNATKHYHNARKSNTFFNPPSPCLLHVSLRSPPIEANAYPSRAVSRYQQPSPANTQGRNPDVYRVGLWTPDPGLPYLHPPVSLA